MSLFTPAQCVLLYQDSLRRDRGDTFSGKVGPQQLKEDWPEGPASRTYHYWLTGKGEQARWRQQQALAERVYNKVRPPWPANAEKEAAEYKRRYLERDQTLRLSACFSIQHTISALLDSPITVNPSGAEWGLHVVAYAFLRVTISRHFPIDKPKTTANQKRQEIKESDEYGAYQEISARLISFIDSLSREKQGLWSFFLRFNLQHNLLVAEWNCTAPEQRSDLSREPQWRNFLDELLLYLDQSPRDVAAVHNALAWASVFNLSDYFPDLRSGYKIANGKEPDWSDRDGFDADVNNFR